MLFQPTQPTLTIVFQTNSHQNEHDEECVVIFESNKDNSMNFLTPMAQQPCDQPNKVVSLKTRGPYKNHV
jgi:hypothetical protein